MVLALKNPGRRSGATLPKAVTEQNILLFLGLAARAGKVISGSQAVEDSVRKGNVFLVIVSEDSSEKTSSKMKELTEVCAVKAIRFSTKNNVGHHIGKPERAVVAIIDKGFSERLEVLLSEYKKEQNQEESIILGCITENLGGVHDRK